MDIKMFGLTFSKEHRSYSHTTILFFGLLLSLVMGCATSYRPTAPPVATGSSGGTPVGTEESHIQKASNILLPKSWKNMNFKVLQSMQDGALCVEGEYDYNLGRWYYTGEVFFWVDSSNATTADEDLFHGDMYWCGTYTYTTVKNVESTVHKYATDYDLAITMVRNKFNLYDPPDQGTDANIPAASESTNVNTPVVPVGSGTGFFVSTDGYILTCYHVVKKGDKYFVLSNDDNVKVATLVSFDEAADLALLKVECLSEPVNFGRQANIRLGETVFTIGFPSPQIQGFSPKVTRGVISGLSGLNDDVKAIQIDAAVQPGNSGGPLLTEDGRVIGIVNARANDALYSAGTGSLPQNINYAVKREFVIAFLQSQAGVSEKLQTIGSVSKTQEEAIEKTIDSVVLIATVAAE